MGASRGLQDNIPAIVKGSSTTVTLAATNNGQPTRITIGGQQYRISSSLSLSTATTGLNGLDTGTLSNTHSLYYVYACANSSGVAGLVASLAAPSTGPSGFSGRYKLVGAFYSMDSGNQIGSTLTLDTLETDWVSWTNVFTATTTPPTPGTATITPRWRRRGAFMEISWSILQSVAGTAGSGTYGIRFPTNLLPDLTLLEFVGNSPRNVTGAATMSNGAGAIYSGTPFISSGLGDANGAIGTTIIDPNVATPGLWDSSSFVNLSITAARVMIRAYSIPIIGWSKTLL